MIRFAYLFAVVILPLAACGDNRSIGHADAFQSPDAPVDAQPDCPCDAPNPPDGPPPDAMIASSVTVANGMCPGTPDHTLTTVAGPAFRFDGTGGNPPIVVRAGDNIEFTTAGGHNFASSAGTPAAFVFQSGPIGAQTKCLTFTQQTPVTPVIHYRCQQHASMTNTLTVLP